LNNYKRKKTHILQEGTSLLSTLDLQLSRRRNL